MQLSIIISTKNTAPALLATTLESLVTAVEDSEIIVVDQNPDHRMRLVAEKFAVQKNNCDIQYLPSATVGLSRGRNVGFQASRGTWLLFFDDDAIFSQETFLSIKDILQQEMSKKIIYYGKVLNSEDNKPYITRSSIGTKKLSFFNFDTVCSIGLLFNRNVIEEIGFFDERFGVGSNFGAGEEADMILRSLSKSIPILYLPEFIVHHPKTQSQPGKAFLYGKGLGALYRKHMSLPVIKLITLLLKFFIEIGIRLAAGIVFLIGLKPYKMRYHFQYLKGFIQGFLLYTKN